MNRARIFVLIVGLIVVGSYAAISTRSASASDLVQISLESGDFLLSELNEVEPTHVYSFDADPEASMMLVIESDNVDHGPAVRMNNARTGEQIAFMSEITTAFCVRVHPGTESYSVFVDFADAASDFNYSLFLWKDDTAQFDCLSDALDDTVSALRNRDVNSVSGQFNGHGLVRLNDPNSSNGNGRNGDGSDGNGNGDGSDGDGTGSDGCTTVDSALPVNSFEVNVSEAGDLIDDDVTVTDGGDCTYLDVTVDTDNLGVTIETNIIDNTLDNVSGTTGVTVPNTSNLGIDVNLSTNSGSSNDDVNVNTGGNGTLDVDVSTDPNNVGASVGSGTTGTQVNTNDPLPGTGDTGIDVNLNTDSGSSGDDVNVNTGGDGTLDVDVNTDAGSDDPLLDVNTDDGIDIGLNLGG